MDATEIIKKVRKIEIKTRGLSHQIFAGEYHSAFKGKGMSFSEVREYQFGDDIRNIDWHVTARFHHPYIKIYEEERELTVMLLIDVSGSEDFGTNTQFKQELITEMAAVLSFSAIQNNDKIGVIFFSNKVEKFIPPKKGKKHILRIIRELLDFKAEESKTNISEALRYLTNSIKKRSIAFVLSDFMDDDFDKAIKIANNKHDVIALQIADKAEYQLPKTGLVQVFNPETKHAMWIDTNNRKTRKIFENHRHTQQEKTEAVFTKAGVDKITLFTGDDYIKPLKQLFKMRTKF